MNLRSLFTFCKMTETSTTVAHMSSGWHESHTPPYILHCNSNGLSIRGGRDLLTNQHDRNLLLGSWYRFVYIFKSQVPNSSCKLERTTLVFVMFCSSRYFLPYSLHSHNFVLLVADVYFLWFSLFRMPPTCYYYYYYYYYNYFFI